MEYSAIVAGTGFENRATKIRLAVKPGMEVKLIPEPDNKFDPNAIAVFVTVRGWYTLFLKSDIQIGYVKRDRAELLSKRISAGGKILSARVVSMHTQREHPRVSLKIITDW